MVKRFIPLLIILATFFATALQAGEPIKIATGEWPPYFSESFEFGGFGAKICAEAFALSGLEAEYSCMPWKRAYESTKLGQFDASPGWRKNTDRESLFYFSDPIFYTNSVLFHRKGTPLNWNKLEDLKDKTIGITLGYSYIPLLKPVMENGKGRLDIAPTDEINMIKLAAGRIDIFPCSRAVGYYLLRTKMLPGTGDSITNHPKPIEEGAVYMIISKKIHNGREILSKFNEGLKELKDSGLYDQYLTESLRGDYLPQNDGEY